MKRSLVVEGHGGPLGVVIEGANVHDAKLLKRTLQATVVPKPTPRLKTARISRFLGRQTQGRVFFVPAFLAKPVGFWPIPGAP